MANGGGNGNGSQLTAARVAALQAKFGVEPSPQVDIYFVNQTVLVLYVVCYTKCLWHLSLVLNVFLKK